MDDPKIKIEDYGDAFARQCEEEKSNVDDYEIDDGLDGAGADGYGGAFD